MPEVLFTVRWPDGRLETCYSPSRVIRDFYEVGRSYTLAEFLAASRRGLRAASDRVQMRYGGAGCSRAMAQLAAIERRAEAFDGGANDDGTPHDGTSVTVEGFVE